MLFHTHPLDKEEPLKERQAKQFAKMYVVAHISQNMCMMWIRMGKDSKKEGGISVKEEESVFFCTGIRTHFHNQRLLI